MRLDKSAMRRRDQVERGMALLMGASMRLRMVRLRIQQARKRYALADLMDPALVDLADMEAEIVGAQDVLASIHRKGEASRWDASQSV